MKTSPNSFELNSKLLAYTALAGATLAAPSVAEAVVVTGPSSNLNIPSNIDGVYLNVVTGATGTSLAATPGFDVNPYSATSLNMFTSTSAGGNGTALGGLGAYVGTGTTYFNLAVGAVVGPASTFGNAGVLTIAGTTPLNLNSSNNYVGFRFFNEATGAVNYGYMQISLSGTAQAQPRSIVSYFYENSGGSITVVPEPSTLALLGTMAAGAVGVRAWRRRKAA